MTHQFRDVCVDINQIVRELNRMRRRIANPVDAIDLRDHTYQIGKVCYGTIGQVGAIGVDVLSEQIHFANALVGQLQNLGHHILDRSADLFAARVGYNTKRAVLAAPFHN